MCIFSGPVLGVSSTQIFGRVLPASAPGGLLDRIRGRAVPSRQVLIYQMSVAAQEEVAMILPLPVPPGADDDAVQFVALDGYRSLFEHLERAFPQPQSRSKSMSGTLSIAAPLVVHEVGAFVASYVPTLDDFGRLDARFRLPEAAIAAVPAYRDFGFAVFQLRDVAGHHLAPIHPMAFTFPTRRPDAVFFPTLHVHDGEVYPHVGFDHVLFAQGVGAGTRGDALASTAPLGAFVDPERSAGLIDPSAGAVRVAMHDVRENADTWLT